MYVYLLATSSSSASASTSTGRYGSHSSTKSNTEEPSMTGVELGCVLVHGIDLDWQVFFFFITLRPRVE